MSAPPHQPQARLLALPAVAGVEPARLNHRPLDQSLSVPRQPQLEEVGQSLPFRPAHVRLGAPVAVAAQQARPSLTADPRQQRPQPRRRMLRRMLVAGLDLDLQDQPQLGDHIAVVGVRRPARLVRIVADHRALLPSVERLDRGIDIEDPRLTQERPEGVVEMPLQPVHPGRLVDPRQRPAHRILAHHPTHPQQRRVHRVAAQRGDMRVALMPGQNRQQQSAQDVALGSRVRAGQRQRTVPNPGIEQAAELEELDEERQLPERRRRRTRVPLDVHPAAEGIGTQTNRFRQNFYRRLLTRRVSRESFDRLRHASRYQSDSSAWQGLIRRI